MMSSEAVYFHPLTSRRRLSRELAAPFATFAVLNVLDVILTLFMLQHGAIETNPMCRFFMDQFGTGAFILYKTCQCLFVMAITQVICWKKPASGLAVIRLGCALYFILMVWDAVLLSRI